MYRPWFTRLPSWLDTVGLEPPAHGFRANEPPIDDLPTLVRACCVAISDLLDLPFVLFGHSFGALVAFEVCRELQRLRGVSPALLIVGARKAPQVPVVNTHLAEDTDEEVKRFFLKFEGPSVAPLENPSTFERVLPMLRADVRMAESYLYRAAEKLSCPILALGGANDFYVTAEEVDAWSAQTSSRFERVMFPGGHFFIDEQRALVLETVHGHLNELFRSVKYLEPSPKTKHAEQETSCPRR